MNSKHKLLRNGNKEVPRVKIQIFFSYLKYLGSGYWIWIKSSAHATVIHSFGKAVSAASMGLASKQETKITKGKWEKCFVQGWNEGQHQMRIKKRALQHPTSAVSTVRQDWQMITSELMTEVFAEEKKKSFLYMALKIQPWRRWLDAEVIPYSWKGNMPGMQSDEDGFAETLSKISSFFQKEKGKQNEDGRRFHKHEAI